MDFHAEIAGSQSVLLHTGPDRTHEQGVAQYRSGEQPNDVQADARTDGIESGVKAHRPNDRND